MATVREPAVAGQFYPADRQDLLREVESYTASPAAQDTKQKLQAFGCIVPHAGYVYSGQVAGGVFSKLELPKRFIILCPNHTGLGTPLSIMSEGKWRTPLGEVPVDKALAEELKRDFSLLSEDALAQLSEHALEVQLPFLQVLDGDFSFVPITVGTGRLDVLLGLGDAIGRVIGRVLGAETSAGIESTRLDKVLIIASSDMNHYESDEVTRTKDRRALERILALDPEGLHQVVTQHHVSMCGFGPAIAMMHASKMLGATRAELIRYATSGDVNGQRDHVVGYAGVAVL
jgi:AmmeMemoRadiSam system protein B